MAQLVKNLPATQETWVPSLGWEDPLKGKATHSVFWPGEFHGLYNPWGHKELDMTEQLSLHFTSVLTLDHCLFPWPCCELCEVRGHVYLPTMFIIKWVNGWLNGKMGEWLGKAAVGKLPQSHVQPLSLPMWDSKRGPSLINYPGLKRLQVPFKKETMSWKHLIPWRCGNWRSWSPGKELLQDPSECGAESQAWIK